MPELPAETDVLIVGGGPAGLRAAEAAARGGLRTLLVEREVAIGDPVHTSGAMALASAEEFRIPARYYHPIKRLRLISPREVASWSTDHAFGCIIDVRGVYRFLASEAEHAGATIATATRAIEPVFSADRVIGCSLEHAGRIASVASKILIDATGYKAELSKSAGLHPGFTRFGVGAEYELVAPSCSQDELVLVVGNRYAPSGYAWVFPWGDSRVRVGVGLLHADTRQDPRRLLKPFLDDAASMGICLGNYEISETHFGLIPACGLAERLAGAGIMAVGDAAGVATLVVGEGIRLSIASGELAGKVAVEAIASGRWDAEVLVRYERQFRAQYGRDISIGLVVNRKMAAWTDAKWDDRVRVLREVPTDLFLGALQSHFSLRTLLIWVLRKPRLWPRLTRWGLKLALGLLRL